jgi:muramoyltetrapeptide carboxypeptidase LdcA involved in peptidoglycan recycling
MTKNFFGGLIYSSGHKKHTWTDIYFKLISDTLLDVFKKEVQCRNDSLSEQKVHKNCLYSQVNMEGGNLDAFIKLYDTGISHAWRVQILGQFKK